MAATDPILETLSDAAMRIVINSVCAVRALPEDQMAGKGASLLKPDSMAANADIVGEEAAFEVMQALAGSEIREFRVIVDPKTGSYHSIGSTSDGSYVWAYLDAVDGTLKVSGLGNEVSRLRIVNDGSFASAIAFTPPGNRSFDELTVDDFVIAAICDSGMGRDFAGLHPRGCLAILEGGVYQTRSFYSDAKPSIARPAHTSTCTNLQQSFICYDAFQAFDRTTAKPGDEELASKIFALAINRNEGGAFDLLRSYGSLSAILRNMISDHPRDDNPWIEPQCTGFLCVNENLPNLIPVVPILLGCGAVCTDFEGNDLRSRLLIQGRANVFYAANSSIHEALVSIVKKAR